MNEILKVTNLSVRFDTPEGLFNAVKNISFEYCSFISVCCIVIVDESLSSYINNELNIIYFILLE